MATTFEDAANEITARFPNFRFIQLGGESPIQGWGTYDNLEFYFHSRGIQASLRIGSGKDIYQHPTQLAFLQVVLGTDRFGAGYLTPNQVVEVFAELVQRLEPTTPRQHTLFADMYIPRRSQ